jgi:hypothetical protein
MDQLGLDFWQPGAAPATSTSDPPSLVERWRRFHLENPHVFDQLRELALYAVRRGARRLSINLLFERLRWDLVVETSDPDFRLNNNHRPYYARALMEAEPELAGVFTTRAAGNEADP